MHCGRSPLPKIRNKKNSCNRFIFIRLLLSHLSVDLLLRFARFSAVVYGFLGIGSRCRFASFFNACCSKCSFRIKRHSFDHRELYRIRHHDLQHPIIELLIAQFFSSLFVSNPFYWPRLRPFLPLPAKENGGLISEKLISADLSQFQKRVQKLHFRDL